MAAIVRYTPMRFAKILLGVAATSLVGCSIPMAAPSPGPVAHPETGGSYASMEARIFELINAERARHGLRALDWNERLDRAAKIQAQNMARLRKLSHTLPESDLPTLSRRAQYVGYPFGRIAENIALGYPNAESVVQGWMASPGHRKNILNQDVVDAGLAVARSSSGRLYYCQVFGTQLSSL